MTIPAPAAPALPDDLEAVLRRLRLPHIRRVAPEVLATARAQRWEPAEVLRALLAAEADGRERSAAATRRAAAGFPTGKTFSSWDETACSIPAATQAALRSLEWVARAEKPGGMRPVGHREKLLPRSPRPSRSGTGNESRLVLPRVARRGHAPLPRR